jgi:hypothetical protein
LGLIYASDAFNGGGGPGYELFLGLSDAFNKFCGGGPG